jgi:hypothetical protein
LKKNAILLLLLVLCTSTLFAQSNRKISGTVTDTSKTSLSAVNIRLIAGKDTISTSTDEEGNFMFSKVNAETFSIQVSTIGYQKFSASYSFEKNEKHRRLPTIALKLSAEMLKEVVIKGKPNPVRFMQDTVEYNADAFQVRDGDNVADLLKQFPGIEVDENYGVKSMGQELVKLRVNGKDFFTNNVSEFINKLPAGIVAKIQVIDDFGDQANFTGIKVGEPTKMLNIVTKPGMNKGKFGSLSANAGTNDQLGGAGSTNLWNDTKQSGGMANYRISDNGAGSSKNIGIGINHRDKLGKHANAGINYNFGNNTNAFATEQVISTVNTLGTFVNNSNNSGDSGNSNHNLNWDFGFNNKKLYLNGNIGASYGISHNENSSFSNQTGVIRQDLKNRNLSENKSPRINANLSLSKRLQNKKNSFSANFGISASGNNSDQNISTNTLYYDKTTGVLQKDSLLTRNLLSHSNGQNFNFGFTYSLGLKKPKDSLSFQSLNVSYNGNIGKNNGDIETFVFDNHTNAISRVDSLSTSTRTFSLTQSVGMNYNYNSKKMRYNLGFNARPSLLSNDYLHLQQKIRNNTFNYSPNINISKSFSPSKTLSINYSGNNQNPSISQLQPIRNVQNLQNLVEGNPDLKPSFSHSMNARFNYSAIKSGISIQSGMNFSTTQHEIVNNIILVPDTLNSLKQITRFENIDGNYNIGGNYTLNVPLSKNKYSISYSGSVSFSNRASFINDERAYNKGFNVSQNMRGAITHKKFSLNANLSYNITNNNGTALLSSYADFIAVGIGQITNATFFKSTTLRADMNSSLRLKNFSLRGGASYNTTSSENSQNNTNIGNVKTVDLNLSGTLTVKKSYFINFSSSKRINSGYAFANNNPFLLNAGLRKNFMKDGSLSLNLSGNDLLNQGNNINRYITGNTIVDSRSNQATRVFSLGLSYNLSKFGGRNFRVDVD